MTIRWRRWLLPLAGLCIITTALVLIVLDEPAQAPSAPTSPSNSLRAPVIEPSLVTTGLEAPTAIVSTGQPSDKRLFVLEQAGRIRIINDGEALPRSFLDISQKVLNGGEMGLLGLAFHPDYAQNGYFYINYVDKQQRTIIARYKVSVDTQVADAASEKVLFTLKQPYANHNGGDLVFGPHDGFLYIALGDGGSGGDPNNYAQNKGSYLGKILRIDVDKGDPYTVPPSNPLLKPDNAKPEIWAYGLRNPWRISFDKKTHELYIADVGQGELEEVNVQPASSKGGENYGWRCFEGNQSFKPDGCQAASAYVAPAFEYNHDADRCSITGGYVYRGTKFPALDGKYFYGDYCNGQLFHAQRDNSGRWQQTLALETDYKFSAFGQASDGELYFADYDTGNLYQITDTAN